MATNVICPRCAFETIEQLYTSPVPGVWEVLQCQQCLYCWRTSEPARRTDRDAYPDEFKMTVGDIVNAPEVPAIPPLLAKTGWCSRHTHATVARMLSHTETNQPKAHSCFELVRR